MEEMNIAYSSDNNYAQHVGVSMLSLFENNKHIDFINVYLIENGISEENKEKLKSICTKYNRKIIFINLKNFIYKINLNIDKEISVNLYARLFLATAIPEEVGRIIYLDSDSIVNNDISKLWELDLRGNYIAGVKDTVASSTKTKVGLNDNDDYINSGMIVIDLNKWRENNVENQFINFINRNKGKVFHHDQGTINPVLSKRTLIIHPKYNAMTVMFTMKYKNILKYYEMNEYYSEKMLNEAINEPVFIHFTPAFVNRPWVKGCNHPLGKKYIEYLKMSPWKKNELIKDNRKIIEKAIAFLFNHFPFIIANGICKILLS